MPDPAVESDITHMHPSRIDDPATSVDVDTLVQQLAAAQSEALYGLHSASATLRRKTADLERAVEDLPDELRKKLRGLLADLAQESTREAVSGVAAQVAELQESVSADTKRHATNLTATVKRTTAAVEKAAQDAADRAGSERELLLGAVTTSLQQVRDVYADSVQRLDDAGGRQAAAAERVEEARRQLELAGDMTSRQVEAAGQTTGTALDATAESSARRIEAAVADVKAVLENAGGAFAAQVNDAVQASNEQQAAVLATVQASGAQVEATATQVIDSITRAGDAFAAHVAAGAEAVSAVIEEAGRQAVAEVEGATDIAMTRLEGVTARLETLAEQVATASYQSLDGIATAGDQFATDATAATSALERVGENIISRLILVLEDRDRMDRLSEERFASRAQDVIAEIESKVQAATDELAAQAQDARTADAADRATAAAQLNDLLDRLLALPRGKLKDIRSSNTRTQDEEGS